MLCSTMLLLTQCSGGADDPSAILALSLLESPTPGRITVPRDNYLSGGETTIFNATSHAFSLPAPNLSEAQLLRHTEGDFDFEANFVVGPDTDGPLDQRGLGPIFNNTSCLKCHVRDGRGRPQEGTAQNFGFLVKLSTGIDGSGVPIAIPNYGTQLGDRAVTGTVPEARVNISYTYEAGSFPDGEAYELRRPVYTFQDHYDPGNWPDASTLKYSPRAAPPVFGRGLLEAILQTDIEALADPSDSNADGISGRPQWSPDPEAGGTLRLGRFARKGENPSLRLQHAGAYLQDMGITTPVHTVESCREAGVQSQCSHEIMNEPEASETALADVTFYVQTLAVPARRNLTESSVQRGAVLFEQIGCASCHVPTFTTGLHPDGISELSYQNIQPFTDLLLHDMGPDLADGRSVFQADGREWLTPALWGLGLTYTVSGHQNLLHDGRARNPTEAILWHGGEAQEARDQFYNLTKRDRQALLNFLKSL